LERGTEDSPNYAKLHLDSATVRAALSALFGKISGSATAHVGSGKIEANYADTGTSQQIDAELDGVDLLKLGAGGWAGVPLSGTAGGTVNVTLEQDPTKSVGDLALKAVDFHIGDGKHKIKVPGLSGGITLEEIDAGTLDLAINLHDGQGDVERFATKNGHDLAADGSGSLRLANPLGRTRLDVLIELKFTDSFKNRNDRTKALFSLLQVNPELRRAVADDGTIGVHLGGTVQALRATPASGTRVGGRPARPKKGDKAKAAATPP
jgi:type II secretion system protein N